jgi:hypothetical protein
LSGRTRSPHRVARDDDTGTSFHPKTTGGFKRQARL